MSLMNPSNQQVYRAEKSRKYENFLLCRQYFLSLERSVDYFKEIASPQIDMFINVIKVY